MISGDRNTELCWHLINSHMKVQSSTRKSLKMLFYNSKALFTVLIVLITTHNLTSSIKWSAEKDRECLDTCNCDPHRIAEPVCGRDGRTYGTRCSITCAHCYLANASVTIAHNGSCNGEDGDVRGFRWWPEQKEDTDKDFVEDYKDSAEATSTLMTTTHNSTQLITSSIKWSDEKDRECLSQCNCEPDPDRRQIEPVCGGDGHTYGNNCSITCAHCYLANASVSIAHDGPCGGRNQSVNTFRWWPEDKDSPEDYFVDSQEVTSPHTTG